MSTGQPRQVVSEAKTWKAMSHPLRQEILRQLRRGPATSTTIAQAQGESTRTTSYHLRVLADAGLIEEVPGREGRRERWWRATPLDLRDPEHTSLSAEDRAALDQGRAAGAPGEIALFRRLLDEHAQHGRWAGASRATGFYTLGELKAVFEGYIALLNRYGHAAEDAPPGARLMQLRMFFLPDELR